MFINEAWAQTSGAIAQSQGMGGMNVIVQLILIFAIFYLLLIRPQKEKIRKHEALLNSIVKGTRIVIAGIEGVVTKVIDNDHLEVEIASGTKITVIRGYVSEVLK